MSKNNLPIKIILQKTDDIFSNSGGGKTKFFSEVTPQLQIDIYSEIATGLRERGYITNNLETRYQPRQRQ